MQLESVHGVWCIHNFSHITFNIDDVIHSTKDHLEKGANYTNPEDAVVVAWRGGGRWLTYIWSVDQWMVENSTVTFTPGTGNQGGEGTDHGTIRLTY